VSNMKLYEISGLIERILNQAEEYAEDHDGEILPEMLEAMDSVNIEYSAKVESIALYIKNEMAFIDAAKKEEAALYKRRKAAENRVERLKSYLGENMMSTVETAAVKVSVRKSVSVEITDESALADLYCNIKTVRTPDKKHIKEAIESGSTVEGASLVERRGVLIK
jgi:polynucleotide 5'-kinase involved in rRNA processing